MPQKKKTKRQVITLPSVLDLEAAKSIKNSLIQILNEKKGCALDASQVKELLSPGLQVLLVATQTFKEASYDCYIINASPFFCEMLEKLNLKDHLQVKE